MLNFYKKKRELFKMKTGASKKKGVRVLYPCTVHFLNGQSAKMDYMSDQTGQDLMDKVCKYFNLEEVQIWGLRYVDPNGERHWLELRSLITSQIVKNTPPNHFEFRVKVYPKEPYKLKDKQAKHQIFLQIQLDLASGKLVTSPDESAVILSILVQHSMGNYRKDLHVGHYINNKIIANQPFIIEIWAQEIHKEKLRGIKKSHAEDMVLRLACQWQCYGTDAFVVKDVNDVYHKLWMNYRGIEIFKDSKLIENRYEWMNINKLTNDNDNFVINCVDGKTCTVTCLTINECSYIHSMAMDHWVYFTTTKSISSIATTCVSRVTSVISKRDVDVMSLSSSGDDNEVKIKDDTMLVKLKKLESKKRDFWYVVLVVVVGVLSWYFFGKEFLLFWNPAYNKDGNRGRSWWGKILTALRK